MPGSGFLYFKNVVVNGALSIQDAGTAPTAGITTTGWTVAKTAISNFSLMAANTKRAATAFSTTDALATPVFSAASCWRSENPYTGTFDNANWTFDFQLRAVSAAAAQGGRVKIRLWKSANATGVGATELTSSALVGSTTAALGTGASQASTVTWTTPGTQAFNNEYFWVQCEWEIAAVSSSNSGDVVFFIESLGRIGTPTFTIPPAYAQSHFRFRTDTGLVDAAPTWAKAEDVSLAAADYANINYRLRISIQNTGAGTPLNTWTLRYSKNGGAYTAITTTSTVVQAIDAGAGSTGDLATIQRLTSAVGTFSGNGSYSENGTTGNVILGSGRFAEFEYGIKIVAADVAANDTIDFQVFPNTTGVITQTVTPRITVGVIAGTAGDGHAVAASSALAVGRSDALLAGASAGQSTVAAVGRTGAVGAGSATGAGAAAAGGIGSAAAAGVATGTSTAAAVGGGSAAAAGVASGTGIAAAAAISSAGVLAAGASAGAANVAAIGASMAAGAASAVGASAAAATSEAGPIGAAASAAGSSTANAEGAATAAANGTAYGTSTTAAQSAAEVPPIVILLPGGGVRVWQRVVAADGHAAGAARCRATGRAFVAANGNSAGAGDAAADGLARRHILHDEELMILLEAA